MKHRALDVVAFNTRAELAHVRDIGRIVRTLPHLEGEARTRNG
ncbi:MAG: hypothetical protein AAGF57_09890 [Pseudomonadota bacterium]